MDGYGNVFRDTAMRWPRAKKGVETLLKKYPDSLYLKSVATRLAVLGNDRDMAKKLYEELGERFVEDAWLRKQQFVHFRTWARTGRW
jgi:predicted Zn-dependent protease